MLFGNRRVEEELERIKKANLPAVKDAGEVLGSAEANEAAENIVARDVSEPVETVEIGFTAKDVLAMIIAALSIVIPYALIFIGVAVLFIYFFFRAW